MQVGTHSHWNSPHFPMFPPASRILLCFCLSITPAPVAVELLLYVDFVYLAVVIPKVLLWLELL